jgi:hypothetical protein
MIGMSMESPSIFVYVNSSEESLLKEILAGIEEEGIPYDIKKADLKETNMLRDIHSASEQSRMGIAIGVVNNRVILHYNKLREEKPLVNITLNPYDKEKARKIGCNAARLYKVMPFKDLKDTENELYIRIRDTVEKVLKEMKF